MTNASKAEAIQVHHAVVTHCFLTHAHSMSKLLRDLEEQRDLCVELRGTLSINKSEVDHLTKANLQAQEDIQHLRGAVSKHCIHYLIPKANDQWELIIDDKRSVSFVSASLKALSRSEVCDTCTCCMLYNYNYRAFL